MQTSYTNQTSILLVSIGQEVHFVNVHKKVLGVIISVEVATHRPPILFLPVDGVLVDCCLSFTHGWIGMAPSYKEMLLEQQKRGIGFIVELVQRWCVAVGFTHHCR